MATLTSDSGKAPARSGARSLLDQRIHVDISDYWWILRRRKALVVTVFLVLLTLILLYSKTREPVYQSSCDIRISARQPMAIIQGAHIAFFGQGDSAMDTEMELISSDIGMLNKTLINLRENTTESHDLSQPVIDYIDKSTGIQTIIQMEALVEIVAEFAIVAPEKILDKYGYKKISH